MTHYAAVFVTHLSGATEPAVGRPGVMNIWTAIIASATGALSMPPRVLARRFPLVRCNSDYYLILAQRDMEGIKIRVTGNSMV